MGAIARSAANLITTSGVVLKGAVNNDSFDNVTALPSAVGEDGITLISSQTASNSASISFTSGLTSTYKAYKFILSNIHPRTDQALFQFNLSTDSGSNYNVTKTSSAFHAYNDESGTSNALLYLAIGLAQDTGVQTMRAELGNGADESISGTLQLFNPSSTTYVKHYMVQTSAHLYHNYNTNTFVAGYGNTTSAINAIRFLMNTGNFDGTIYLYGIK